MKFKERKACSQPAFLCAVPSVIVFGRINDGDDGCLAVSSVCGEELYIRSQFSYLLMVSVR